MYLTFIGVIALIATILAIAKEGRRSASYVFTAFEPNSGWTPGWSWVVGVLHAAYANSATGMVISMSEEVERPHTQVPKAMVGATVMNFVIGFVFLVPLTFVLPDISAFLNDPYAQPVPVILRSAVGSEAGAFILSCPLMILGIFCGTACTTATSRSVWAFARDGALPASNWLKKVHPPRFDLLRFPRRLQRLQRCRCHLPELELRHAHRHLPLPRPQGPRRVAFQPGHCRWYRRQHHLCW
jgi:amino acid transporter